ncbi:hypothetical protein MNBD_IGNAVI01-3101 [hydrothermal vent metagenome]|uniref:Uncharacterized protein n=1 Tax=hydrothermal vent metagenome TaxID=652676 RepID=A0A3B1CKT4_9ZZZZ
MNKAFLKAVEVGVKYKFPHWNDGTVGTIGIAIADMVLERLDYELDFVSSGSNFSNEVLIKLMKLSYIFLSRKIEIDPENSHEAFSKRACLSQHYSSVLYGIQTDRKEEIISDYYDSSISYAKRRKNLEAAKFMRIAISLYLKYTPDSRKNFSKGNLYRSVLIGREKNEALYNELLKEYRSDQLELNEMTYDESFWQKLNWMPVSA